MKKYIGLVVALLVLVGGYFAYENFSFSEGGGGEVREKIVYETEVDGPNDCSSLEKYDEERNVCTFECDDETQCSQIELQIDAELNSWAEEMEQDKEPVSEKKITKATDAEASYAVSPGEQITFKSGTDTEENRNIWQDIARFAPDTISDKYIESFEVFNSPTDDTLAFVDDEDGNGKWRVAVNIAGHKASSEREQKSTIIHELGHIITLNTSQVNPNISSESCTNFFIDEGCSNQNSYVNNFKNKFWNGVNNQEFDENKFVTEYAATNEVEDMAESFAFFVITSGERDGTEKSEKISFFYNYPELVNIRNAMRQELSKNIVRAKIK